MKKTLVYLQTLKHNKKNDTSYFAAYTVDENGALQVLWPLQKTGGEDMKAKGIQQGFDYISRKNELDVAFCIKIDEDTDHHTLAAQRVQTILRNQGKDVTNLEVRVLLGRSPSLI